MNIPLPHETIPPATDEDMRRDLSQVYSVLQGKYLGVIALVNGVLESVVRRAASAENAAALRVSGGPAVRDLLLNEFGTTDPELLKEAIGWAREREHNWDRAVERLHTAIRQHRDERGDDRCHLSDGILYAILPEGDTRPARETAVTLQNCQRYIECRQSGREYISPQRRIEELEAMVSRLQRLADGLAERCAGQAKVIAARAEKPL